MSGFSSAYVISIIGSWLFNRLWRESQQLCLNAQILALDNPTSSHCEVSHKGIGEGQVGGDIISHEHAHRLDFTMVFLLVLSSFFWCVLVCVHACMCVRVHAETRGWYQCPLSHFLLYFLNRVSQWAWSLPIDQTGWQQALVLPASAYSPEHGGYNTHDHALFLSRC